MIYVVIFTVCSAMFDATYSYRYGGVCLWCFVLFVSCLKVDMAAV